MNYKPSDTMNLVHEVKKLGWHFTHSKENISINRHNVMLSLYREVDPEAWREDNRKKQAAGVRFEKLWYDGFWRKGECDFTGKKEDYREVPQETSIADKLAFTENNEPTPPTPHAAERALWKAQREAGTNEVWQEILPSGTIMDIVGPPAWAPRCTYRVKPMKLTAVIVRKGRNWDGMQGWEFTGTREEYRAECEKYGYAILSEIKEVVEKPKTVKYYFALATLEKQKDSELRLISLWNSNKENLITSLVGCTIIGDIESREVEV